MKMQLRMMILIFLLGLFSLPSTVRAEDKPTAGDPYGYIAQLGPITFSQAGGAFLPANVLSSLGSGQISPIMQFVLTNHMMDACVQNTFNGVPMRRDPFTVAQGKFQFGLCQLKKCFQQGMLLSLLPQLSGGSDGSGSPGSAQQGMMMAQAFGQDPACDGSGGGGIDPMLLMLFQQSAQQSPQ